MTYKEQLNNDKWKQKRQLILKRDLFRCTNCLNKSLIEKYRISLQAIGTYQTGRVIYVIYDKETKNTYRCKTQYEKSFIKELQNLNINLNSIIALTAGIGDFTYLISTLIVDKKLDLKNLSKEQRQNKQEEYLKWNREETYKKFKWIDTKGLHVHHRYYQIDKLAWEYPDEALITLCWNCHELLHRETKIEIRDLQGNYFDVKKPCQRCFGAGKFPEYSHVQNGICFRCDGNRFENYA